MRAAFELAPVARGFDNAHAFRAEAAPVRLFSAGTSDAEPLAGHSMPILEPGVAYVPGIDPRVLCQQPSHPRRVLPFLFDPQEVVFAIAVRQKPQVFRNLEVGVRETDASAGLRASVGALPVRQRGWKS